MLFNRRAEIISDENAQYQHDVARRTAIRRIIHERVEEGINYEYEKDNWDAMTKVDRVTWRKKQQDHTEWIIKELERKCQPKYNAGFNSSIQGRVAAYRDLLHAILQLENNGGIT